MYFKKEYAGQDCPAIFHYPLFTTCYLQSRIILSASSWDRPYLSINFTAIS
ncbi:hypothetical protein CLOSCI_01442 [[Clostridium] scindens ATCC 35704]|nr:hypothetical protein CLOSCI_01442 [[Clostridium] scindens ATCC 35704]